jgi:hypothetical protein
MTSPAQYVRSLLFERAARRAAMAEFRRAYPHDRARWPRVIRRDSEAVVIAIEYGDGHEMPAPDRFFRVSRAELTAAECDEPPGWGPWF